MKHFFSSFFLLLLHFFASAQTEIKLDWLASASGSYNGGPMTLYDMANSSDGSVVAVGCFTGTVDFDPGSDTFNLTSVSKQDIFIVKWSREGKLVYAHSFGGKENPLLETAYSVAIDDEGNAYMTGIFSKTVDFDPGKGTALLSAETTEVFAACYNKAGAFKYAKQVTNTGTTTRVQVGKSITVDPQHNIYITGSFSGNHVDFNPGNGKALFSSGGKLDIFFAKYDSSGNYVFAKTIAGNYDDGGSKIELDHLGNIVVCGQFSSSNIDFDPGAGASVLSSKGKEDIFFAKYDSSGNYLFVKSIGGTAYDAATSLAIGTDNSIVLTGNFTGKDIDFDADAGVHLLSSKGSDNTYVAKYNEDGSYLLAFSISGPYNYGYDVAVNSNNDIFIAGYLSFSNTDFDPGSGVFAIPGAKPNSSYIARYTSQGKLVFAESIGNFDALNYRAFSLVTGLLLDKKENVLAGGYYQDTLDVDPGTGTSLIYAPERVLFIAKYTSNGSYVNVVSADNYFSYSNASIFTTSSVIDNDGNVYITGYFEGKFDFDPGPGVYIIESSNDYFYSSYFAKYDKNGNIIFAKAVIGGGSPISKDIAVDKDQNIYLTGTANASTDFNPSDSVQYWNNNVSPEFINGHFFAKYNKAGALIFAKGFTTSSYYDEATAIAVDSRKNIYVAGYFDGTVDFDPSPQSI